MLVHFLEMNVFDLDLQVMPDEVCSQIGLCPATMDHPKRLEHSQPFILIHIFSFHCMPFCHICFHKKVFILMCFSCIIILGISTWKTCFSKEPPLPNIWVSYLNLSFAKGGWDPNLIHLYTIDIGLNRLFDLLWVILLCSNGIEMVTEKEQRNNMSAKDSVLCTSCEMAVVWVQNQLREKATKEKVLDYINQVILLNQFAQPQ